MGKKCDAHVPTILLRIKKTLYVEVCSVFSKKLWMVDTLLLRSTVLGQTFTMSTYIHNLALKEHPALLSNEYLRVDFSLFVII